MTKFCMWVDIHDVITYATFGDDRFRGQIFHFSIDLHPYNTFARQVQVCDITLRILIVDKGKITNIFVNFFPISYQNSYKIFLCRSFLKLTAKKV